jgi:hypothetical protein
MPVPIFFQGDDYPLIINVTDPSGAAVDVSAAGTPGTTSVRVSLYGGFDGQTLLKTYTNQTPTPSEGELNQTGLSNNQVRLLLQDEDTRIFPAGQVNAEVVAVFVNTDYPAGQRKTYKLNAVAVVKPAQQRLGV